MGRILGAHGVRGLTRVALLGERSDPVLMSVARWWLMPPGPGGRVMSPGSDALRGDAPIHAEALPAMIEAEQVSRHGDTLLVRLVGVADRDAAEALKGREIAIPRSAFPRTGPDEYYWGDLEGCQVRTVAGAALGLVDRVLEFGADPVLSIVGDAGRYLIPFVAVHVTDVDLSARSITVDWNPEDRA
ncbi:MAG: ribosome maturation factor RimM [Burkholderiaceae bacterium]